MRWPALNRAGCAAGQTDSLTAPVVLGVGEYPVCAALYIVWTVLLQIPLRNRRQEHADATHQSACR